MKIIHVIDYYQPQLGYQETFLCQEQSKMGHDVFVITSERYSPAIYESTKTILGKRINKVGFFEEEGTKVFRLKTLFEIPHAIWIQGLEDKINEIGPDIVIMHGIVNLQAPRVALLKRKLGNFKLIIDDHMTFNASGSKLRVLYPVFKLIFMPLLKSTTDVFVAVAPITKTFMSRVYGIPLDRITVISLGADIKRFQFDSIARQQIRQQISVDDNNVLFVYAGKIIPEKGPHLLVEAAIKMKSYNNFKVLLLGNGPNEYIDGMKQKISAAKMEDVFVWLNAVPNKELPKVFSACDVAVWPRQCALTMMEAMSIGLPVVISNNSEVMDRLRWQNGLTFISEDPNDLASQMGKLLDSNVRNTLGKNGKSAIENELNWQIIAKQFIDLVE
jgi:glycosyltransferase involved in cell wall biosynthesis